MFMPILSGLVVSVDAFFIGLSLGIQKKCRFLYVVVINIFLLFLCLGGFFIAERVYESIPFDPDLLVGFSFIFLGSWTILHYFISEHVKKRKNSEPERKFSSKRVVLVGLVMSVEAMLITMGITLVFLPYSTLAIPITVALAHFAYSALSFRLARGKRMGKISPAIAHTISGLALIIYGLMAIFVEISI